MSSIMERMKNNYEKAYNYYLPYRIPVIIRLDGKCFHNFCKKLNKPFDKDLINCLNIATLKLCQELSTVQLAYIQSDEVSLLLHSYKKSVSEPTFNNEIQKLCSISASILTAHFNYFWKQVIKCNNYDQQLAYFDSRCFVLPENEVCNYFIARQNDWERNSLQLLARSLYSHKELNNKKRNELQEMCFAKGQNWNDLSTNLKRGRTIIKINNIWKIDNNIPEFTKNRFYIERHLLTEE